MKDLPFTVYDFFGYIVSGLLVLATLGYLGVIKDINVSQLDISSAGILIIIAYILGHIIALLSKLVLDKLLIKNGVKSPTSNLLTENKCWYTKIIPDYFEALPEPLSKAIKDSIPVKPGKENDRLAIIEGKLRHDEKLTKNLDIYLTQYGFCRNTSLALLVVAILFFSINPQNVNLDPLYRIWIGIAALAGSLFMALRYLKFYWHYTNELFVAYGLSKLPAETLAEE